MTLAAAAMPVGGYPLKQSDRATPTFLPQVSAANELERTSLTSDDISEGEYCLQTDNGINYLRVGSGWLACQGLVVPTLRTIRQSQAERFALVPPNIDLNEYIYQADTATVWQLINLAEIANERGWAQFTGEALYRQGAPGPAPELNAYAHWVIPAPWVLLPHRLYISGGFLYFTLDYLETDNAAYTAQAIINLATMPTS